MGVWLLTLILMLCTFDSWWSYFALSRSRHICKVRASPIKVWRSFAT